VLLSSTATNASHSLDISIGSYHFNRDYEWNEVNPGLIYRWKPVDDNNFFFSAGIFKNSFEDTSIFGGIGNEYVVVPKRFTIGYNIGLVSGYSNDWNLPVLPMLTPYVTVADKVNFTLQYAGRYSSIGLSLKVLKWD